MVPPFRLSEGPYRRVGVGGRGSGLESPFRREELLPVVGVHEGVRARVQAGRVRVPEPDVHGDQVRVPEVEGGSRSGGRLRTRVLGLRGDVATVLVVAAGAEGAVLRA